MINPLNKLYEKFPIIRDLIAFSDISVNAEQLLQVVRDIISQLGIIV